uniref:ZZ-type domain-containing protein n=1 Tax=Panagrellus redivivus TaxID=6233 RepID=A0A7E4ZUI3_PANRE
MSVTSAQSIITELDGKVSVKWENDGVFHRFWLPVEAMFSDLMQIVEKIDPNFDDYLAYKDDEGDMICIGSTDELREFLRITTVHDVLCVMVTKPKDPAKKSPPAKSADRVITFPKILPRVVPKVHHRGISCSSCQFPVIGIRYQCIDCDIYNLCESCEKTGIHEDHSMIRMVTERSPRPSYVHLNRIGAFVDSRQKERGAQTGVESNGTDVVGAERLDPTKVTSTNELTTEVEIPDLSCGVFPIHKDETKSQMSSSTVTLENAQDEFLHSIVETTQKSISSAFQILNLDVTKPPPPIVVNENVNLIASERRHPEFFANDDDDKSEMSASIVLVENREDELHRSISGCTREISNTYEILNLDVNKSPPPSVAATEEVVDTSVHELLAAGDRNNASVSTTASNHTFTIVSSPESTSADNSFSIPSSAASLSGSEVHSDFDILSNPGDEYEN